MECGGERGMGREGGAARRGSEAAKRHVLGGDVRRGEKGTNRVRMRWGRASVAITRQRLRVDKQKIIRVFSQNCHPNFFFGSDEVSKKSI
jgi:hypothetical protein